MTKDEALTLALEALETAWYHVGTFQPTEKAIDLYDEARAAIKEALAQPAVTESHKQEPVAWATREDFYFELNRRVDRMREEMMIKTITMRCKEYDLALPIVDMYGGHIVVGQVSFPPQRKPLTDEEIQYALESEFLGSDEKRNWQDDLRVARATEAAHDIKEQQ